MSCLGRIVSISVSLNAVAAFFFPSPATGSDGLAGQVQSREPEQQPDNLVWPLHHLHRRLGVSGSSGDDEVTVAAAKPVSLRFPAFTIGLKCLCSSSGVAYLCGHLHTLGGLMPVLHSRHPRGTLELELGDWMDNRRSG